MRPISIRYPHFSRSAEPRPMKAGVIREIAATVRRQVFGNLGPVPVDVEAVIGKGSRIEANGIALEAHWDLDHAVTSECGDPAMGVCDYDPASPGSVMVSINGELMAERGDLMRSTVLHEFGHLLFDSPSWVKQVTQLRLPFPDYPPGPRAFRCVTPDEGHLKNSRAKGGVMDWREFRANEFMGAFLVPPKLLCQKLTSRALEADLPFASGNSKVFPGFRAIALDRCEYLHLEAVVIELAEVFGVSPGFIRIRLARYDLARRP